MHGVGSEWVARAFEAFGLAPYIPVSLQIAADPEFPTVAFPNPEEGKGALVCLPSSLPRFLFLSHPFLFPLPLSISSLPCFPPCFSPSPSLLPLRLPLILNFTRNYRLKQPRRRGPR
jgi:hypothetical protein